MDIIQIATHLIDEDTDQPRYQFDEEALQELMKSIEEIGLLSPIKVRTTPGGRYKIIYGNRRYKASKMLGKETIPCIVSTVTDEMEIYLEQIAENLTREGFSPIEEAEAFHKLMNESKFNSSIKYLANKLGKPESYIKNKCELLKFGNSVRKLIVSGTEIREGKLTEDQLLPIKDLPIEHRDPLALIIARDALPVSDVKKIAKLFKDKEISSGTKDKLLYKNGHELLQTWSTVQQNKAERERAAELAAEKAELAAEAKAERARRAAEAAAEAEALAAAAVTLVANGAISPGPTTAVIGGGDLFAAAASETATAAGSSAAARAAAAAREEARLLLTALPLPSGLADDAASGEELQALIADIDGTLAALAQRAAAWQSLRELAVAAARER
ncbi:ParB/RepB/Spo0J family partition protein [Paenibacillus sp. BC26]|uniref:ParB/RepB/Spo0J family partition protein n=1 Tax=Paenibacillus sp. BC26 TaxID=1881032 RepID=UPI0008F297D7|nr:ParB/RepB/Spo0J family partition protein [Paenibacillus sp. BC26]SFT14401.1 chromosome partitioning protein, ParB family [Paenibacillus sp. BC26]